MVFDRVWAGDGHDEYVRLSRGNTTVHGCNGVNQNAARAVAKQRKAAQSRERFFMAAGYIQ